jgi:dTDP-4-dehydrorhamnose reductase
MDKKILIDDPEVWGGIECTINRIGEEYKDQLEYSGHYNRPGDIEVIAALGIKTIRYPILWERHQPGKNGKIDWGWAHRQLQAIRDSGMKPIAGLMHHGSGPSFTNLLDPEFPYLLADYAYAVASRFPWIDDYTPVNEPLTTARFSGLYGLWYPHHRNERSFYRMLLNQLKGTALAMEAIRSINHSARLVQTEDLGKTYSTALLSYQANFENERRLLTFDLLTGQLTPGHPQYQHILSLGISEDELQFFQNCRSAPDMLGLNYYVTSERWLDESLEQYPLQFHGGNGIHRYADTERVRTHLPAPGGFKVLATEIWDRYRIPMAVTECHLHCTREEQLRWFKEMWDNVVMLRSSGIDIKGVTAWALLGSFDWDTLLTKTGTQYESGVFDIKTFAGQLRRTALANLIKNLNKKESKLHPVLGAPGWWHETQVLEKYNSRPIVILQGAGESFSGLDGGQLSFALAAACRQRRISVVVVKDLDEINIDQLDPWAVINLGRKSTKNLCAGLGSLYVTFNSAETADHCLKIVVEQLPMGIHQINRVLDLMIDGDQGCWIFGVDKVTFGAADLMQRRHIA